jgi:hypothetical protein
MKKFLPLLGMLLLSGCATVKQQNADSTVNSVAVGQESHAGIGDTFFTNELVMGNETIVTEGESPVSDYIVGVGEKTELTVEGATNEKLTLNYAEYTKESTNNGYATYFYKNAPWLIKSGFNSQYSYDLTASKTITFKGYEFQVLGVQNNVVTYKRTK